MFIVRSHENHCRHFVHPDRGHDVEDVEHRHLDVEQYQIRLQRCDAIDRLLAIDSFPHNLRPRHCMQQSQQSPARWRFVVGNEDAQCHCRAGMLSVTANPPPASGPASSVCASPYKRVNRCAVANNPVPPAASPIGDTTGGPSSCTRSINIPRRGLSARRRVTETSPRPRRDTPPCRTAFSTSGCSTIDGTRRSLTSSGASTVTVSLSPNLARSSPT